MLGLHLSQQIKQVESNKINSIKNNSMKYKLETKNGEVINTCDAVSEIMAIEYFACIKKMSIDDLLKIFKVKM